jgi:hypothetical protein
VQRLTLRELGKRLPWPEQVGLTYKILQALGAQAFG